MAWKEYRGEYWVLGKKLQESMNRVHWPQRYDRNTVKNGVKHHRINQSIKFKVIANDNQIVVQIMKIAVYVIENIVEE